jgi:queuine tRNA-ribosyltransferase
MHIVRDALLDSGWVGCRRRGTQRAVLRVDDGGELLLVCTKLALTWYVVQRDASLPGYAIGGLAGGEDKESFCAVVEVCCRKLPEDKPR